MTLANIIWKCLSGSQAHIASGTDRIRRYARGYSPIIGFADPSKPDFGGLEPYCTTDERFYTSEWAGSEPPGWAIDVDTSMCAMIWRGEAPTPDPQLGAVRLTHEHVARMVALAQAMRPGPFAERTFEMGEFYGVFEGGELVAMAGERMQASALREISGVCTAPGHQGRGLARRLTELLIRRQLARGQVPFLHVASDNERARRLYGKLGFVVDREVPMRVIRRR